MMGLLAKDLANSPHDINKPTKRQWLVKDWAGTLLIAVTGNYKIMK